MKKAFSNVKNKVTGMKASDKKGMAAIGWILTIVFTLAVVGIIWRAVSPAVNDTARDAQGQINDTTSSILEDAVIVDPSN